MFVAILKLDLHIPANNSLKHKRMILNSFKGRTRSRFNVSVAEVDCHVKWQRAIIAVCQVSADKRYVQDAMDKVLKFSESFNGVNLLGHDMEML